MSNLTEGVSLWETETLNGNGYRIVTVSMINMSSDSNEAVDEDDENYEE